MRREALIWIGGALLVGLVVAVVLLVALGDLDKLALNYSVL